MKSPLKKRRLEELRLVRESEEVQRLRKELAEIHQKIQQLILPAEKAYADVPARVRTDFLVCSNGWYMSVDLSSLQDDGHITNPARRVVLSVDLQSNVRMFTEYALIFGESMGTNIDAALKEARKRLQEKGWVFVGAEFVDGKIKVTYWRELS